MNFEFSENFQIFRKNQNFRGNSISREKNQIKMRDAPFQLKISKEDSDFRPLQISGAKTKVPIKPFLKVGCHFRVKRYRG